MGVRLLGKIAACIALAAAGLAVSKPAGALSNAGLALDATVSFAPGLSSTPAAQTVQVTGSGVLTVVRHGRLSPITVTCSFSGASVGAEDVHLGSGTLSGGCGPTDGEPMSLWCGTTYQRASGAMTLTGGCTLGMADGTQSTMLSGTLVIQLNSAQPVTSAAARAALDLATVEAAQFAVGSGASYHQAAYSSTWVQVYFTLAGVFTAGSKAEAAVISCVMGGYGAKTLLHEVAEGRGRVSCSGTTPTGQSVGKTCDPVPFVLLGAVLTTTGQCTLWVAGVGTHVFEQHSYALALGPNWGGPPGYVFTVVGSHQAVAP